MAEDERWQVCDEVAGAALVQVLTTAASELSTVPQPVLVAANPTKIDHCGNIFDWLAVQVGRAHWERTAHGPDNVREQSFNPDQLITARAVLRRLVEADWRALAEKAFGEQFRDESLALVLQYEAAWLVVQSSWFGDSSAAFLLDQAGATLIHVGWAGPLDHVEGLGSLRPLRLDFIRPGVSAALRAAAPAFPCRLPETPEARYARFRLGEVVGAVATDLRTTPGTRRYVGSTYRRESGYGVGWRMVSIDEASAFGADQAGRSVGQLEDGYAAQVRKGGPGLIDLDRLLRFLDKARWGDMFITGVMPLEESEPVALLARGDDVWIVAAGAVFSLVPDAGIMLVGVCDLLGQDWNVIGYGDKGGVVVHLFDGRSVAPPELAASS